MAMSTPAIPSYLLDCLRSPNTKYDAAVDALEEWISGRRAKGATLFEVSVGLAELEAKTPPFVCRAFDRARYVTNVPQPSDLTPPTGPFPLARSQSVQSILHHLLSKPTPSILHSREVILEYVLAREGKLREKKPGRGGKGTLGREGFEEISKRLSEIEDGLKGLQTISPRRGTFSRYDSGLDGPSESPFPSPLSPSANLDEARTIGLTLILSLRLSLSYFTLQGLAEQLLVLATPDAERTLVQHIRRRVSGEGRFGVGKELEFLESLSVPQRPALRPVFRSTKVRTHLPSVLRYPIVLPAPSKSACIKQLLAFAKDVENGVLSPAFSIGSAGSSFSSPSAEKRSDLHFRRAANSPASISRSSASPRTPMSANPLTPPPARNQSPPKALTPDPEPLKSYALELISEYLTREKREYMIKQKWAKSGRDQLGKDLGDIEASLCVTSRNPTPLASTLLPVFLLLRRTFALPPSPLPSNLTETYLELLPAPPDPDEEPFREPNVQTTTVALYQNPRLEDDAAMEALEEMIENEKEKVDAAGATDAQRSDWCLKQIESVKKRFPDGSYEAVFAAMSERIMNPSRAPDPASTTASLGVASSERNPHRRTQSGVTFPMSAQVSKPPSAFPQNLAPNVRATHARSFSMPMRKGTYDDEVESVSSSEGPSPVSDDLPPLLPNQPPLDRDPAPQSSPPEGNGSPLKRQPPERIITTPNHIHSILNTGHLVTTPNTATPASSGPTSSSAHSPLSVQPGAHLLSPVSEQSAENRQNSEGGWWDVVSAVEPANIAPWHDNPHSTAVRRMSITSSEAGRAPPTSAELPLPPGAEPATVQDMSTSFADMLELDPPPVLSGPPAVSPMRAHGSPQSLGSMRLVSGAGSSASSAPIPIGPYPQPAQPFATVGSASPTRARLPFASSPSRSSPRSGVSPGRFGGFFRPSHSRNSSSTRAAVQSTSDLGSEPSIDMEQPPGMIDFSRAGAVYGTPSASSLDSLSADLPVPSTHGRAYSPSSLGPDPREYMGTPEIMSAPAEGTPIWQQYSTSPPTTPGPPTLGPPASNNTTPVAVGNGAPSPAPLPSGVTPSPGIGHPSGRPKLFARSVTLTLGTKAKGRDKDKNKENEKAGGGRASLPGPGRKDKEKVSNKPKNWNRDMVADIMGPPAERR